MRYLNKIKIIWSPKFAYAIGLLATDGCLYNDGRHIDFTSKDIELVEIFKDCFGLDNKITRKTRSTEKIKKYFRVQFGDVNFYKFLNGIGLFSAKSKTIGPLQINDNYFFDFLRGCLDGDGSIGTFKHPESRNLQLRVKFCSASEKFLRWIQSKTIQHGIKGFIMRGTRTYILQYAMQDSINLLNIIYYKKFPVSLNRKFVIAKPYLRT